MGISPYMRNLRAHFGTQLVLNTAVSAIVRNESGQILFVLRADNGRWDLPGGAIDPGETPARAIVREVHEETGLIVEPTAVAGVFGGEGYRVQYANGDQVEYTVIVFECRVVGGKLAGLDGEAAELHFISAAEHPPLEAPFPDALFAPPGSGPVLFM
jgi:mutator protein MutT